MIGPRALRNQQLFIQQALEQKEYEKIKQEQHQLRHQRHHDYACNCSNCFYESTARAAQRHTNNCNDNTIIESENYKKSYFDDDAITFWSQHILNEPQRRDNDSTDKDHDDKNNLNNNNNNASHLVNIENYGNIKKKGTFARCTSFTNDIYDGRLNHDAKEV